MDTKKQYTVKMHIGFGNFRAYKVKATSEDDARDKANKMASKERKKLGLVISAFTVNTL